MHVPVMLTTFSGSTAHLCSASHVRIGLSLGKGDKYYGPSRTVFDRCTARELRPSSQVATPADRAAEYPRAYSCAK